MDSSSAVRYCGVVAVFFLIISAARSQVKNEQDMRLPQSVIPESYTLRLLPIIEENNFTISGYEEIIVHCVEATSSITMNSADIEIDPSSVQVGAFRSSGDLRSAINVTYDDARQMVTIHLDFELVPQTRYKILLSYVAQLKDELRGFYRSSYEENGLTKYLAVTQFSAPDARRAFPCFDEPNMKATFTITLGRKETMVSSSNMPITKSEPIQGMPGYLWDVYPTTDVVMSTYLVGMMVSEFVETPSASGLSRIPFTIRTRPSLRALTNYAGLIGPQILKYFEYYTQIDYPLPKVDLAAIPDFAAGAMENWGHINFKEADLLIDEKRSSEVAKQRVAEVTGHELGHMWFGNLVTHDWWSLVWLKEGFARYMQYVGTDAVEPGFQMDEQFGVAILQSVFQVDSLESSRPLKFGVDNSAALNTLFDVVVYDKGASIVRMMANFLGFETFRRSMTRYLNSRSYANAVQEDLWQAIQEQADIDGLALPENMKTIMEGWTNKMGYPIVTVTRNYDTLSTAQIKQGRFLLRKSANSTDTTDYRWWIPLTYTRDFTLDKHSVWMSETQTTMTLSNITTNADDWLIFNVGQTGYYRVMYDETNYGLILKQLLANHEAIPPKNRAQLLDDTLNIARANLVSYEQALDLTRYLVSERDYAPWTAAVNALDFVDIMLYGYPDFSEWIFYMRRLVKDLYTYVGFEERAHDSHLLIYTRSHAIHWSCYKLSNEDCVKHATNVYSLWMSNSIGDGDISPNLLRLISCTAIANGDEPEWEFGYQKYLASTIANEKVDLLKAMACTNQTDIINRMLDLMIDPTSGIRLQDANTLFSSIAANPVGHPIALDFLATRWDEVNSYFSGYIGFGGSSSIPGLFRSLCNRVNTEEQLAELTKLRNDHMDVLGSSKSVNQGLELAQSNVQWVKEHSSEVVAWLKNENNPQPSSAICIWNGGFWMMTVMSIVSYTVVLHSC